MGIALIAGCWLRFGLVLLRVEDAATFLARQAPNLQGELALHRAQDRIELALFRVLRWDATAQLVVHNRERVTGVAQSIGDRPVRVVLGVEVRFGYLPVHVIELRGGNNRDLIVY